MQRAEGEQREQGEHRENSKQWGRTENGEEREHSKQKGQRERGKQKEREDAGAVQMCEVQQMLCRSHEHRSYASNVI